MDFRQEVHDAFNRRFDAKHKTLVWSHPGMNSWYRNASGRVTTTSPWRLVDYWGLDQGAGPRRLRAPLTPIPSSPGQAARRV